jgi:hypothetical protein
MFSTMSDQVDRSQSSTMSMTFAAVPASVIAASLTSVLAALCATPLPSVSASPEKNRVNKEHSIPPVNGVGVVAWIAREPRYPLPSEFTLRC